MVRYIKYIAIILIVAPILKYTFDMLISYSFFRSMDVEVVTSSVVALIVLGGIFVMLNLGWNGVFALFWVLISRSDLVNVNKGLFIIISAALVAVIESVWSYMSLHQRVQLTLWESTSQAIVACVVYATLGLVLLHYSKDN